MTERKLSMPILIVKPGTMTRKDIRRAEKFGGICVVENKDPNDVRFLETPIQAAVELEAFACMTVMRIVMNSNETSFPRGSLTKWFVDCILNHRRPKTVEPVNK